MRSLIIDHRAESPTSTTFILEKPTAFSYQSGQFIHIELAIADCDTRCNKRNFSLASSPTDDYLMITTRHGVSRFKQTLESFKKGDSLEFTGPFGRFALNEDQTVEAVMLSGGIGITPLHSMVRYATHKKLTKKLTLIYSNSYSNDIPFKTDLDELDTQNDHFTIHHTFTKDDGWNGRKGRISEAMIRELVPNFERSEFYIVGPAVMVLELKKMVKNMGIADNRIKSELFTGY